MSTRNARSPAAPSSPGKILGIFIGVFVVLGVVLWLIALANRLPHEIAEAYGRRRGHAAAESVNGTVVLSALFEAAGRKVSTITELGRRAEKFNTIVWTPDSFAPPNAKVETFLEQWLAAKKGRTLVYIGRDYDAAPEYWQRTLENIPLAERAEYERRWARAQARVHADAAKQPSAQESRWFTTLGSLAPRKIDSLDGPWAKNVQVEGTHLVLGSRLDLPHAQASRNLFEDEYNVRILLQSENDLLAYSLSRTGWQGSKIIVVANGGFTLNLPLVNGEHRKLAGQLVSHCSRGDTAFLESGSGGPAVRTVDSGDDKNHVWRLFTVWPIGFIFVHLAALGIAFCISAFPIFGRAYFLPKVRRSDFGQHVEALGELLRKTKDYGYAEHRIRQYQQQARRSSGKSHAPAPTPVDLPARMGENKQGTKSP